MSSPATKRAKMLQEGAENVADDQSGDANEKKLFEGFEMVKVLNESSQRKMICVQGKFGDRGDAVVVLEKTPFSVDVAKAILTGDTTARVDFINDIYHNQLLFPPVTCNGVKSTMVFPATEKHIAKYTAQDVFLVEETPEDYKTVTLPYIENSSFSIQWVYNILEHKKEAERIVFEDADPEKGFILIPDMKWSGDQVEDLYLVAIVHKHGIRSIRELTQAHLPLLTNIHTQGLEAIKKKYGVPASKLRIYLHYQPSYYHLHVHFTHLKYDAPGSGTEKAHLLSDVIDNIQTHADYYQKKTLTFVVRENEGLCQKYKEAGRF